MHDSIWTKDASMPEFPPLAGDTKTDVLIIGGGLAGLLCCAMLQNAGIDCLLIEADRICSGISQNTTAKITTQHGLIYKKLLRQLGTEGAQKYYSCHQAALHRLRKMAQAIACDWEDKNNYIFSRDGSEKLEAELAALQTLGIPSGYTQKLPLPFKTTGAICFPHQAQFHPLKFAAGIADGMPIREQTRALEFQGRTVRTDRGTIRAEQIIVTTHFPMLNKHGAYFLKLYQHRSYVMALSPGPDLQGMYLDCGPSGLSLRNHGSQLLLGGGGHRTGSHGSGWQIPAAIAAKYFPKADVTAKWATQDCMSLDGRAYIGPYGRHAPGLYVATGFQKWGMTGSMAAAMILSDCIQGKENPYASVFSPQRSMLHPQLLCNSLSAIAHLLTPTRPRCPHMGCALKWNRAERSWDCPCHGSRFSADGKLLNNPANHDKKRSRS